MQNKLPRGVRLNNPGNIRISNQRWLGKVYPSRDKSFETFTDMKYGVRAALIVIRSYLNRYKLTTVPEIITRWAPNNENDTRSYINAVSRATGRGPQETLTFTFEDMHPLLMAIFHHENGGEYVTEETFKEAWKLL